MNENKEDIGPRLKQVREYFSLKSKDFAKKAGISSPNYSSIENGKRNVGDRVLNDICKAFGINIDWLKTGTGDMFKPYFGNGQPLQYNTAFRESQIADNLDVSPYNTEGRLYYHEKSIHNLVETVQKLTSTNEKLTETNQKLIFKLLEKDI